MQYICCYTQYGLISKNLNYNKMKKLFRVKTIQVDGFEGNETESYSYIVSDLEIMEDDDEITQDDVVEADVVFLEYNKYENIGEIADDEIKVLIKFGIISKS